jgi:hypothetical protein
MNTLYRYVPEKVHKKIKTSSFKNKEHLYVICDMLYRVTTMRKEDTDYSNKYIDIPASYIRDIITDGDNYQIAKNYLIDHKIIECDNHYSKIDGKALGYRFTKDNISKLIPVEIKKPTLINRIVENRNKRNNFVNKKYTLYKEHFLNTFAIDHTAATIYINDLFDKEIEKLNSNILAQDAFRYLKEYEKLTNQYNHLYISINAINDGQLYFSSNKTNNRIDNNLTSLKSELKRFIISNHPLHQIDIVNSQPFLLSIILNEDKNASLDAAELGKYTDWVTQGLFYENFKEEYQKIYNTDIEREEIKPIMFCIFYSKNTSYKKEKAIFENIFPTIHQWIVEQKTKNHNTLAIKMQKFESAICIDQISLQLDLTGIKYYTIHDAWLVNKNDLKNTIRIVENCFLESYKTKPELDKKRIENVIITNNTGNIS